MTLPASVIIPIEVPAAVAAVLMQAVDGAVTGVNVPVVARETIARPPLTARAIGAGGDQHARDRVVAAQRGGTVAAEQHFQLVRRAEAAEGKRRGGGGN